MTVETKIAIDPASLKAPAVFSNKFQAMTYSGMVRVSFGEAISGHPPVWHCAVSLTAGDARELAEAILSLLPAKAGGSPH